MTAILGAVARTDIVLPNDDQLIATLDDDGTINIRLTNRSASDVKVRIAIGVGIAPALGDYIEYDSICYAGTPLENTGIAVSKNEKVWVRAEAAVISVRVMGIPYN